MNEDNIVWTEIAPEFQSICRMRALPFGLSWNTQRDYKGKLVGTCLMTRTGKMLYASGMYDHDGVEKKVKEKAFFAFILTFMVLAVLFVGSRANASSIVFERDMGAWAMYLDLTPGECNVPGVGAIPLSHCNKPVIDLDRKLGHLPPLALIGEGCVMGRPDCYGAIRPISLDALPWTPPNPSAVPIPPAMGLFASALAGLGILRGRRKRPS